MNEEKQTITKIAMLICIAILIYGLFIIQTSLENSFLKLAFLSIVAIVIILMIKIIRTL